MKKIKKLRVFLESTKLIRAFDCSRMNLANQIIYGVLVGEDVITPREFPSCSANHIFPCESEVKN